MAQLVRGETARQRHQAAALQQLVGALEGRPEDAGAQVVGVALAAGQGREDEGVGVAAIGDRLVGGEDVAQDRQDLDLAQAGRRLGAADEDARACQIDVAPEQVAELVRAGAGEDERGDDRLAFGEFVVGVAVELGRRLQQRLDLRGAVDVDGRRALLARRRRLPSAAFSATPKRLYSIAIESAHCR